MSQLRYFRLGSCVSRVAKNSYSTVAAAMPNDFSVEYQNAKPFNTIPGPKTLPFLGNVLQMMPKIGKYSNINITDLIKVLHEEYGKIVKLEIPGKRVMVFLYDPDDIEKVFRNEGSWPMRVGNESLKYYREVTRANMFKGVTGLVVSQGESWQTFRSKVNQPMLQPKSAKLYISPIEEVVGDFLQRLKDIRNDKLEMPEDFLNELGKWAFESVAVIALDTRLGCLDGNLKKDSESQKIIDAVEVMFECFEKLDFRIPFWKLFSTPTWRKLVRNLDYFNEVSMKHINHAVTKTNDMSDREASILQKILAKDPEKTTALAMALDMVTAGIDTTSYTAANTLYLLAKNPDKQEKLFEEIKSNISSSKSITANHINNARYLKACVKESLRLLPVAPANGRTTQKEFVLSNYRIPAEVDLIMCIALMCRKAENFPEPDKFIPERWLKDSPENVKNHVHPFVYLPFGFGTRMCIGRRLAELELEVLLMRVIQNFRVEYNYGDMKFKGTPLLHPALPLKLKLTDRQ